MTPNPLELRNLACEKCRQFLAADLDEVITPLFVKSGGIEPYVEPLSVFSGVFLPTSPEISLKKTLAMKPKSCQGVFEIAHAFRNDEPGAIHLREFTMLEWYRRDFHYMDLKEDVLEILGQIGVLNEKAPKASSKIPDHTLDTVQQVFSKVYHTEISADWGVEQYEQLAFQNQLIQDQNLGVSSKSGPAALHYTTELFTLLFDHAMNKQAQKGLAFVYEFPPFMRGMAELSSDGWAKRLEGYYNGLEICSGYQELSDAEELEKIWRQNNEIRKYLKKTIQPIDEGLIAVNELMKNVAGMALGVERTLMGLCGISNIQGFTFGGF